MFLLQDGTGTAEFAGVDREISGTCTPEGSAPISGSLPVTGGPGKLTFSLQQTTSENNVTQTTSALFSGALNNAVVSGTLNYSETIVTTLPGGVIETGTGTAAFPVTLR